MLSFYENIFIMVVMYKYFRISYIRNCLTRWSKELINKQVFKLILRQAFGRSSLLSQNKLDHFLAFFDRCCSDDGQQKYPWPGVHLEMILLGHTLTGDPFAISFVGGIPEPDSTYVSHLS